jgi:thermostable 8-oxoguanine DNA glycosylase
MAAARRFALKSSRNRNHFLRNVGIFFEALAILSDSEISESFLALIIKATKRRSEAIESEKYPCDISDIRKSNHSISSAI